MKKVNIITIHFGVNHGSALQSWALSHYIDGLEDCQAQVIDYVPRRYRLWNSLVSRKKGLPVPVLALVYPAYALKNLPARKRFERFLKANVKLTRRYSTYEELSADPPRADVYIAGSDQIWNDDYNGAGEESYYLGFAPVGSRKIAYAASFGKHYPLSDGEAETFAPRLANFDAISVREDEGVDIVRQCGGEGVHVCDPTLLLDSREWSEFASGLEPREPYLLVYVMDYGYDGLLENARILAEKAGLKVYVISFSRIKDPRVDKCFHKCSPKDFVALVKNARMVVTNSFHGTAFSTIFRKPMLIVGKKNYNSRMLSLLKKAELLDRFVEFGTVIGETDADRFLAPLNRETVDSAVEQWVGQSKEFLHRELKKGFTL